MLTIVDTQSGAVFFVIVTTRNVQWFYAYKLWQYWQ